jgi:queuine/archaeosine tRNA-ribosyltransferase
VFQKLRLKLVLRSMRRNLLRVQKEIDKDRLALAHMEGEYGELLRIMSMTTHISSYYVDRMAELKAAIAEHKESIAIRTDCLKGLRGEK